MSLLVKLFPFFAHIRFWGVRFHTKVWAFQHSSYWKVLELPVIMKE